MEKKKDRTKKDGSFAKEVRAFFGMPEPGQKKLTAKEMERQTGMGKIPTKAGEPKKRKGSTK